MAGLVADLYVRLSAITTSFDTAMGRAYLSAGTLSAGLKDAQASADDTAVETEGSGRRIATALAGTALAVGAVIAASVKLATAFQTSFTQLQTQAGLSNQVLAENHTTVSGLQSQILSLGTTYGYTGTQMAQALYYPLSSGLSLATALQTVSQAAMGAQISGADLTDTTTTLTFVLKDLYGNLNGGVIPAQLVSATMANLNAIVGNGTTTFSDLNSSVRNWAPAMMTFMGSSTTALQSTGAALDFLTDRGDTASTAGTRLAMVMSMLGGQTEQAASYAKDLGLSSTDALSSQQAMQQALVASGLSVSRLADDMRKPDGIFVALSDLKQAMTLKGVNPDAQNAILEKMFGGSRSFRGAAELYEDLGGIQQKFQQITQEASSSAWQQEWSEKTATLTFQLSHLKAWVENTAIAFGMVLIPKISQFIDWAEKAGAKVGPIFTQIHAGIDGSGPGSSSSGGWYEFGQILRDVGGDLSRFVGDVARSVPKVLAAFAPVAAFFGGAALEGLKAAAGILADVVGPAISGIADFLDKHRTILDWFVGALLTGLIIKMTVLGGIKAATGILNLGSAIVNFPLGQLQSIGGEFGKAGSALSEAWSGGTNGVSGLKTSLVMAAGQIQDMWGAVRSGGAKTWASISANASGAWSFISRQGSAAADLISDAWSSGLEMVGSGIGTIGRLGVTALDGIGTGLGTIGRLGVQTFEGIGSGIGTMGRWGMQGLDLIGSGLGTVGRWGANLWSKMGSGLSSAATGMKAFTAATVENTVAGLRNAGAWVGEKVALIAGTVAEKAAAVGEWLLNTAMLASPLTWIIAAIILVAGAFLYLWTHVKGFRDFWIDAWRDIRNWLSDAVSWITSHLNMVLAFLGPAGWVILGIKELATHWSAIWNGIGSALTAVYNNTLAPIFNGISAAVRWVNQGLTSVSNAISGLSHVGGVLGGIGSMLGFADGGYVPGAPGQAMLAIVHGGEYVLSREMLLGQAPIDDRAMTGIASNLGGGGGGSLPGLAATGAAGGSTTIITVPVTVQGPMLSTESAVQQAVISAMNRFGMRNTSTYQAYGLHSGS